MTAFRSFDEIPSKRYGVIYADPAWKFATYGPQENNKHRRDAEQHYPTMTLEEIKALPIRQIAARDCWLMMWTTWPHLPEALEVMAAWGFKYSSSFKVWAKLRRAFSPTRAFVTIPSDFHVSTGYTTRKGTEPCLLGRRGSPKRLAKNVRELLIAPVREHSRKPDEMYGEIERFAAGPYIELNARTARPNWDQWGNDIEKFMQPASAPSQMLPCAPLEPGLFDEPARPAPFFHVLPGPEADDDAPEIPAYLRRLASA